jgi:hypothetical protein
MSDGIFDLRFAIEGHFFAEGRAAASLSTHKANAFVHSFYPVTFITTNGSIGTTNRKS